MGPFAAQNMNALSSWLARRKRRREVRKLMRQWVTGIKRSVAFEKKIWEVWIDFCETDFVALWADYAVELDKNVEDLTTLDKQQAHMNYLLRDRKR